MTESDFAYKVILRSDDRSTITSLVAYQPGAEALRAVLWSARRRQWIYAPNIAAPILYDDQEQDRGRAVDRQTAERISRDVLDTELPTEQELTEMSEQGEAMGWNYGPPRTSTP